jgi:hypothetical protein
MWRITVRDGPRVEKLRATGLVAALDLVEREGRALSAGPGRKTVEMRTRTFAPQQQVAGRVELAGRGVRAGIDVRGDGAAEAWTGRVRRHANRARATPAGPRSAASGPSPRGGRPRARRRSRGSRRARAAAAS